MGGQGRSAEGVMAYNKAQPEDDSAHQLLPRKKFCPGQMLYALLHLVYQLVLSTLSSHFMTMTMVLIMRQIRVMNTSASIQGKALHRRPPFAMLPPA